MQDLAIIRGETEGEKAARQAAETPLRAFLVVERFAKSGAAAIREQDLPGASREEIVRDLAACQWDAPHRILFVDETSGICRDVSAEIAEAVLAHAEKSAEELPSIAAEFCARHSAGLRSAAA